MNVGRLTGRAATQFRANLARLRRAGQMGVLGDLSRFGPDDIALLHEQLKLLPWESLAALSRGARTAARRVSPSRSVANLDVPSKLSAMSLLVQDPNYWLQGTRALESRRIAVLTVAGGRASRLGAGMPKGLFQFLPDGTTLFEWFAMMLHAAGRRSQYVPPWIVMLSPGQMDRVRQYFEEREYFGLPPGQVHFIPQRLVPTFDDEGHLMPGKQLGEFLWNPGGHGGVFEALRDAELCPRLRRRGVTHLVYHQIDNPLAPVLDPQFLGMALSLNASCVSAAVRKRAPEERAGVFAERQGKTVVIEYSELPSELAEMRDKDGVLTFGLANMALHVFDLDAVEVIRTEHLPRHWARKLVARGPGGESVYGNQPEQFVFDALRQYRGPQPIIVLDRAEVFAPIKNAEGDDSVATCLEALHRRSVRWLEACRVVMSGDQESCIGSQVIIKPSFALSPFNISPSATLHDVGL